LSKNSNSKSVDIEKLVALTPREDNTPVLESLKDQTIKSLVEKLIKTLENRKYGDYLKELLENLGKFKVEQSDYNEKIAKYSTINNRQLNKQLKQ